MRVLRGNGVFIFAGVPGRKGPVEVDADLIMTGRFPIEEVPKLLSGRASGIKEVVAVGGRP